MRARTASTARWALAAASLVALSGCATFGTNVRGNFSCAAPDGTCAPSSVIDDRALAMIAGEPAAMQPAGPFQRTPDVIKRQTTTAAAGTVTRVGQKVLAIVFPAHVDAQGRYHETSTVRAVVDSGAWLAAVEDRGPELAQVAPMRVSVPSIEQASALAEAAAPVAPAPAPAAVAAARARGQARRAGTAAVAAAAAASASAPTKAVPVNQPTSFSAKVED